MLPGSETKSLVEKIPSARASSFFLRLLLIFYLQQILIFIIFLFFLFYKFQNYKILILLHVKFSQLVKLIFLIILYQKKHCQSLLFKKIQIKL